MNICKICNEPYKQNNGLSGHLRYNHTGINTEEYYKKFIQSNIDEGTCKYPGCGNATRFMCISKGYCRYCSNKHAQLDKKTREKIQKTNLERYGLANYINIQKIQKTKLDRYGDAKYNNRPRCSSTLLSRSTEDVDKWRTLVQCTWKAKTPEEKLNISNRRIQTYITRNGKHPYDMMKYSIYKKYGVDNISHIPEIVRLRGKNIKKAWMDNRDGIIKKVRDTNTAKYGYDHIMHSPLKDSTIFKAYTTRIKLGQILPRHLIPEYQIYKSKVYSITKKNAAVKFTDYELGKIGMCGVDGAMQVDHIYTIKDGFVNNIPPYIIGSHVNIQLVDWKTNDTKKDKSEITKDQLILLYSKIAHPEY